LEKADICLLRLLQELETEPTISQRELARRLKLSLGRVTGFLKTLARRGDLVCTAGPGRRLSYRLTAQGRQARGRLADGYLGFALGLFRELKQRVIRRLREMEAEGVERVLIFGAGELSEIALLYLPLTHLRLMGIVDDRREGRPFFGLRVADTGRLSAGDWDRILLTRVDRLQEDMQFLAVRGIPPDRVVCV